MLTWPFCVPAIGTVSTTPEATTSRGSNPIAPRRWSSRTTAKVGLGRPSVAGANKAIVRTSAAPYSIKRRRHRSIRLGVANAHLLPIVQTVIAHKASDRNHKDHRAADRHFDNTRRIPFR